MRSWWNCLLLLNSLLLTISVISKQQNDQADNDEMENEGYLKLLIGTRSLPAAILKTRAEGYSNSAKVAINTTKVQESCDIAYDCHEKRIVWSDLIGKCIRTAWRNGTDEKEIYSAATATHEKREPNAVAIDWSSRTVYFINWGTKQIGVVDMKGRYHKYLTGEQVVAQPHALALDLENRHIFFSKYVSRHGRQDEVIARMDMDGSNLITFLDLGNSQPLYLAVVPIVHKLCWVRRYFVRRSFHFQIWCMGLDQSNRDLLFEQDSLANLKGWTVYHHYRFYWTSQTEGTIFAFIVSDDTRMPFSFPLEGHETDTLCGIATMTEECTGGW